MMRSVGYFLVKAGKLDLALAVFDRVRDLAPCEPQSFLDAALVRMRCLQDTFDEGLLREALTLAARTVTHAWAERFAEVEWPALLLLHLLVDLGEQSGFDNMWPLDVELRCKDFEAGLLIWLGWDTDKTDIDLHVREPSGNEVYYCNKRSSIGGHLSRDFTQGYGPEVYLLKTPIHGEYIVQVKYYASHQQSTLTGATSAVLWTLQGGAGGRLGLETVRLDRNKEKMDIVTLVI